MVDLGHHLEKPRQQSLMTLLIKSTHTCGQTLVKSTVKPYLKPNVLEHPLVTTRLEKYCTIA
jgi:hypothetical protein